jgi:hypothetical protein
MIAKVQEPVPRVVPLSAVRAGQVSAPASTMPVEVLVYRKGRIATTRYQVHPKAEGFLA